MRGVPRCDTPLGSGSISMMMQCIRAVCLCVVLIVPTIVAGADDGGDEERRREIDQAVVGDTAVVLESGETQLTLGVSFEDDDTVETVELFVEVEYGVTDWLEFGVQVPYLYLMPKPSEERDVEGIGDMTLSISLALLAKHPFWVSTSMDVTLATGDDKKSGDLGEGVDQWAPSLIVDVALGEAELVVDVGGEFGDHISIFVFDVTMAYAFGEVVVSLGVEGSFDGDEKDVLIVPGIGFPVAEDIELAIEVPFGVTHTSANWKVGIELTFEF